MMPSASRSGAGDKSAAGFEAPHPGVRHPRSRRGGDWSPITNGIVTSCFGLLVLVSLWTAATRAPVEEVTSWQRYTEPSGLFSIEHPRGWSADTRQGSGGSHTRIWRSDRVDMEVWSQPLGWNANSTMLHASAQYNLLAQHHRAVAAGLSDHLHGYRGGPTKNTILGQRRAVWASVQWGSGREHRRGYQVTLLAGTHVLIIIAAAPTDSWDEFKPIALRMLRSLRFDSIASGALTR